MRAPFVFLWFLICFAISLQSCKRENPPPSNSNNGGPVDVYVAQDLIDYGYFLVGTFLVYQDSASGSIDSTYVTGAYSDFQLFGTCPYFCSNIQTTQVYWRSTFRNPWHATATATYGADIHMQDTLGGFSPFMYPSMVEDSSYHHYNSVDNDFITLTDIFPSYTINSNTFTDVLRITHSGDPLFGDNPTVYFVAKNVGIVRYQVPFLNRDFKVVSYSVEQ